MCILCIFCFVKLHATYVLTSNQSIVEVSFCACGRKYKCESVMIRNTWPTARKDLSSKLSACVVRYLMPSSVVVSLSRLVPWTRC